ncbi:pyridoxal phosphate-dependent aminotransferase [Gaoshiqia sediminis]|uniref:Aminotransferase n=1 Tax=Gaoshiqia sediminis TaxID=2986998 RepID=A0AA41Y8M2_9BACT|nr:aminotransferase class I/II-fold pyridoxal phosphate-dependent enzyme [Gaoshiqia sediminis]MCW0483596.1 histidinol-phosphate aminotransferase family protein [Gaoshiqia sediminis]
MKKIKINRSLFAETSHSPALADMVGEDQLDQVIDFCFIANPYYPTRAMVRELARKMPEAIKAYPSSNPRLAQQELAAVLKVNPDHLILGNGATELITLVEQELIDQIAIPVPTFSEYLEKLRDSGAAHLYQLPTETDYRLDLMHFGDWIDQRNLTAALVINPGNPTGQFIPRHDMLAFLKRMGHLQLIVVDESFIDFAGEEQASLMPFVADFPNLLIVRSMSKHCGVPGLRLGYCCTANTGYLTRIRRLLPVWNINTLAELFLSMLKKTDEAYQKSVRRIVRDIRYLYRNLKNIPGYKVYPTGSNFILLKIENGLTAQELQYRLLEGYGVYVRDCSNKVGLDQFHIRVASQGRKNDQRLIDALNSCRGHLEG